MIKKIIIISIIAFTPIMLIGVKIGYDIYKHGVFLSENPQYVDWKENGGPLPSDIHSLLCEDRKSYSSFRGLNEKELKNKYPFLTDGDSYSSTSYKYEYLLRIRFNSNKTIKIYWLRPEDTFDWAIILENGYGQHIRLVKG